MLYSPDSCGCIFEMTNEGFQLVKEVYLCELHDSFTNAHGQNQLKNQTLGALIESKVLPNAIMDDVTSYDDATRAVSTTKALNEKINYKYFFKDGIMYFSFEGVDKNGQPVNLSNANKASMSGILNSKLGPGRHQIRDLILEENDPEYAQIIHARNFRDKNYLQLTAEYRQPTFEEKVDKNRLQRFLDVFKS